MYIIEDMKGRKKRFVTRLNWSHTKVIHLKLEKLNQTFYFRYTVVCHFNKLFIIGFCLRYRWMSYNKSCTGFKIKTNEDIYLTCFFPWYDIRDIMTNAACGAGNPYPSIPDFTSGFIEVHVVLSFACPFDFSFCLIA